jgi:hypothetical protein
MEFLSSAPGGLEELTLVYYDEAKRQMGLAVQIADFLGLFAPIDRTRVA